jgi:hypothetical protein
MKKKPVMREMNDAEMYQILQDFANQHTLARDVFVTVSPVSKGMTAKDKSIGANYDDANLLMELIKGAEAFLFWARRKHIVRFGNAKRRA